MKRIILLMTLALTVNGVFAYEYNHNMIDNAVKEDQKVEF